jgi:WD40 repeat protein
LRQFDNYNNQIMSLCFSQEGLLAIGGFENQVLVLDREMEVKYQTEDCGAMSVSLDFSQDGQLLAVAGEDSVIRVYNVWKVNYVVAN